MRKFNVTFEVFMPTGKKQNKIIVVEAGNKKLAALRAMMEINKLDGYSQLYKNVVKVEEVA
jgi:hypothetical protein